MEADIVKNQIIAKGYSDEYEKEYIRKDGTIFPISIRVWLIKDEEGKTIGMWGIVRDITERKRVEEELKLSDEIIRHMEEGVYLIRVSDGIIVFANPKFERMFGYEPGEMTGKHVSIVNAPSDKGPEETAGEIIEILNKQGVWSGEINNIKKDGTTFWCYATVSMLKHHRYGTVWVSIHQDISERKQAEDEVKRMNEELKRRAAQLEAGLFPLKNVLFAAMTMLKEKAIKHNIDINLEIEPNADIEIEADERKLKQIMFNLLNNAVKFTNEGGCA